MFEESTDPNVFEFGEQLVKRGQKKFIDIKVGHLYDYTELSLPICVLRGKEPGPVCFLSGVVHGDEIIGSEVIKRLLLNKKLKIKKGTIICIPIVNVYGFNNKSRYLPDRRDLNRCFPGSEKGSLSSRLANIFFQQIISKCHFGIDLHSAAVHRCNLPQIRAYLHNPTTKELASTFGAPVVINSKIRDGSIRGAAENLGISVLVFEGGEALRFDEQVIEGAKHGILKCLKHVGMIDEYTDASLEETKESLVAASSYWVRASQSGVVWNKKTLGEKVEKGSKLGLISDVFFKNTSIIRAKTSGIVIGENRLPLVNEGDALFHIATFEEEKIL